MTSKAAWGGILGPAAFIAAWSVLGARTDGYDPVHDPISRLAALGAGTRTGMTAGFVAYAAGVTLHAGPLRHAYSTPTAIAALTSAVATVGIAALPLEGPGGGAPHAAAAGVAYAALAATPLLGGLALRRAGRRTAGTWSFVAAAVTGSALAASALAPTHHGLLQRTGLTTGDAWLIASALGVLAASRGRSSRGPRGAASASGVPASDPSPGPNRRSGTRAPQGAPPS